MLQFSSSKIAPVAVEPQPIPQVQPFHWTIAAPFYDRHHIGDWLVPFVPGDRHQFQMIPRQQPPTSWHNRSAKFTTLDEWLIHWQQGKDAIQFTQGGVITVFPQLAATVGALQRFGRDHVPVVAWLFNVGTCSTGARRWLAKQSLQQIDRFVVHTRRECQMYSEWLDLPVDRFEFVHYQGPEIPIVAEENVERPFIAAIGSAHRDFPTLFEAVQQLNLPTVLGTGPRAIEGLTLPAQVQAPMGIGKAECIRMAQEARINVVPLIPKEDVTAAGQITIVEAMRMGRAVIATRGNGVEDYITHGETGWLVDPHSVKDLTAAIDLLWHDEALRQRLGQAARQYALDHCSDEAAGRALGRVLDRVLEEQ